MTVTFHLEGQEFIALNGGPHYTFSPAISFFVNSEKQAEVDELGEAVGTRKRRAMRVAARQIRRILANYS